ncbi:MAG: FixH family protein [Bacteroidetes bacterium]|nr:FixH family protein [Bacteroidota bacterium]
MKTLLIKLLVTATLVTTLSCTKKNQTVTNSQTVTTNPTNNLIKIGEVFITGAKTKAIIYSTKQFEVGFNEVYISFIDSIDGSTINSGKLFLQALMNMGTMSHGCPVENSTDSASTNGYYKTAVVFSMPGTSSEWSLNINFQNKKNGLNGLGTIGVNVSNTTPSKVKNITLALDSNKKVIISILQPSNPKVGTNDFEITIHNKLTSVSFPPITNYSVEIVPEMPSMGHGSPNNINPIHTAKGHYLGKVNFTMTGLWYVHLNIYKNGSLISNDQYFEFTLQ